MSTQHQLQIKIICPSNMRTHAILTNQAAQNVYHEFNNNQQQHYAGHNESAVP